MEMQKKLILGVLIISIFVFVVAISSLYVQIQIQHGNVCSCIIPLPIFIPFIASLGLFIGTLTYYFFVPLEKQKIDKHALLMVFSVDERKVIDEIIKHKEITQASLISLTGLSKVKIFRIVDKLCKRGILKRVPYGKTNKLMFTDKLKKIFNNL